MTTRVLAIGVASVWLAGTVSPTALQHSIAACKVDATRALLDRGADPNVADASTGTVAGWLASGMHCTDDDALAVAKLLESHGATFAAPRLLVNLAPRHLPKTLAFVVAKKGAGDPTEALRAIAREDDLESIRALLDAGADPTLGPANGSALLDATMEGHAAVVAAMLDHVKDAHSPKVAAAYAFAAKQKNGDLIHAFAAAGAPPPPTSTPTPACSPHDLDPADQALLAKLGIPNTKNLVGLAGPMQCKRLQECGDLVLIDCNSAADGPAYYVDRKKDSVLSTCGGACMHGCTNCPPKEWTCGCSR